MKDNVKSTLNPDLQRLCELISDMEVALLTTLEPDGTLHSRPMKSEAIQPDGVILFFTRASSAKGQEIQEHAQVSLSYMGKNASTIVAIAGRARMVQDPARMKELWNPLYKAWFPQGLNDPDLVLLEVTIERAEYWETPSSMVVRVLGAAKALVTGQAAGETMGEHRQMQIH